MVFSDFLLLPPTGKTCAVESKSVSDLVDSFAEGRLEKQLAGLRNMCDIPYLLVKGELKFAQDGGLVLGNRHTKWGFQTVMRILDKAQLDGVFWQHVANTEEALQWVVGYYRYLAKSETHTLRVVKKSSTVKYRPDVAALCAVPDLGPKLAQRMLAQFGSVLRVAQAEDAALRGVQGCGEVMLRNIRLTFGNPGIVATQPPPVILT